MNIVILDDYQDVVRKLNCAAKLDSYRAKVFTNTIKGNWLFDSKTQKCWCSFVSAPTFLGF